MQIAAPLVRHATGAPVRVAVLDDDAALCELVQAVLRDAGCVCSPYQSGRRLMTELRRDSFDLLVLDWEVPDVSGLEIVVWVRDQLKLSVPVLFLTCRGDEADVAAGLTAGADDYMVKPVRPAELAARVFALLRRAYPTSRADPGVFDLPPYRIDVASRQILYLGEPVELTQKEFELAVLLFRHLGRLLSRSHIQQAVWGQGSELQSRTVDTHVSRVRSKLKLRPESGFRLTPVYSLGYRLEAVERDTPPDTL